MALAPQFAGHRLGSAVAPHTPEIYLGYAQVWPFVEQAYPNKVQLNFRQQVQPWHASSTLVHEAALVVEKIDAYGPVENKSHRKLLAELAKIAEAVGVPG
ncbi:hypothetical protein BDB00DRAFT_870548 [Zychaea mexicana]|uniref:uncharacterized protein n=1 Tax=Zychaea mexicana TaxID=64656 RepID=UPI0022FDC695|nr:uncharacterized protein BDB00DRAFT_870548 [Zychaea mexicana]KAI9495397.1 hypothetical protein BDB00DRAFT_870548 [Zychaea mexicana]